MGRAIDMEKDIDALKLKIKKLEDTVRGMVSRIDEIEEDTDELYEKASKTKHVDLVEDVGVDTEDLGTCVTGVAKDEEEKTNDEGDGKSSKSVNTSKPKSSKKNK